MKKIELYSIYERIWHWLMAGSIILLLITGIEIHFIGSITLLGFQKAIFLHNLLAIILIINGALSLFYHILYKFHIGLSLHI